MIAFPRNRTWALLAMLALAVVATIAVPSTRPTGLFRDFEAFYCAGESVRHAADPYRSEPIGACERRSRPAPIIAGTPGLAMPAPLPPYALAPFRLLSVLPFVPAVIVWLLVIVASVAASAWAVHRITALPLAAVALAFVLSDGYASLCLGQIAPIAVAAIALGAWLLHDGRDRVAACVTACAMIEPHVGLPACAALFVYRSRARVPLVLILLTAVAASVAVTNASTALEYARAVLPAHALSEIANEKQFSLTYALHRVGAADELALRIGELWYAAMVILGIVAAGSIAKRTTEAAVVVIPPALAVLGGPFVHIVQIAAALPAALLLFAYAPHAWRRPIGIAIVALAIPWVQFANLGTIFFPLAAIVTGFALLTFVDERPAVVALGAFGTLGFFGVLVALVRPVADPVATLLAHYDPHALAEASWALYVRTVGTTNAAPFDLAKLPTIGALCTIACATYVQYVAANADRSAHVATGGNDAASVRRTTAG